MVESNICRDERKQKYSIWLVLIALGFMYSVHNLIAPNMTAIAKLFHFNNYERDAYIGGELTLFFYFPGVFGALLAGVLSGILNRSMLLASLAVLTSIACLLTARVGTFGELAWARAMTGFGIGGSLPVVYSLIGDWFPAKKRARATAYVSAASGVGVFVGQCVATITGSVDWRWPFFIIALPSAITGGMIWYFGHEPIRGGQEDTKHETQTLYDNPTFVTTQQVSRQLKALRSNRTNMFVLLSAFPGNIPWGVIIVYIHDFLVQDLGLSTNTALGAIAVLSASAFVGVLFGGFVGEQLYGANSKYLGIFGGACNTFRAVPFFIIFGWTTFFGPLAKSSETAFYMVLMTGGLFATMASACTGAMLLNVNLPEMRGSVMAMYSVLDDLSKGFGTLFVSMIVRVVGGRALAYQLSLLLWVATGIALSYTWYTYDEDEEAMRKNLDDAAQEAMVVASKMRAQQAIRDRAKAAGAAHFALKVEKPKCEPTRYWKPPTSSATGLLSPQRDSASMTAGSDTASVCSTGSSAGRSGNGRPSPSAAILEQRERLRRASRAAAEAASRVR